MVFIEQYCERPWINRVAQIMEDLDRQQVSFSEFSFF